MTHMLVVPVEGVMHLMHRGDSSPEDILRNFQPDGQHGCITLPNGVLIEFLINDTANVNTRARKLVADMFGVHIVFTGPVGLRELSEEQTVSAIKMVSAT